MRILLLAVVGLCACATAALRPDAARIQLVTAAPDGCAPLGVVIGSGGGALGGGYISNKKLIEYAINDALNSAADRGATHAVLQSPELGSTGSNGNTVTSSATVTAIAFRCP